MEIQEIITSILEILSSPAVSAALNAVDVLKGVSKLADYFKQNHHTLEYEALTCLDHALEQFCKHYRWEYDVDAISETVKLKPLSYASLNSEATLHEILQKATGQTEFSKEMQQMWIHYVNKVISEENLDTLFKYLSRQTEPIKSAGAPRFLTDKAPKAPTEFVSRQETIVDILNRLNENKNLVVVNGMGGVGKSAICKWLFHYFEVNSSIPLAWVEYDGKNLYECFVKQFHYPGADIKERENLLSTFIQQDIAENSVIFIDNLDVIECDEPYIQKLTNARCRVVCSSRITDFDFFEPVRIDLLSPHDSQILFLSYYSPDISYEHYSSQEQNIVQNIVEKLAYHTLTIEVIAKIGRAEKKTLEDIQVNLDRVGLNFSGIAKVNLTERTLIGHLCRIFSVRKLGLKHRQILGAIALYPMNQVPKRMLYWLDIQNNVTIRFLARHAWFTEDGDSFYMHPIIKEVVHRLCPLKYENSGALINAVLKKTEYRNNIPILKIMEWIPYAEQIVKRFRYNYTLEIACLQYNIATAYSVTGNYTLGLRYITPAIQTLEKLGTAPDQLALAYNHKGYIYYSRKNYSDKRAHTFYQKAMSLTKVKGRTRVETYESLALCLQGMYENGVKNGVGEQTLKSYLAQAEVCHIEANKFFLETKNKLHLASSYNNTGDYYRLIGNSCLAIRYYNRARKIREEEQMAAGLDLSITYFRLGEIYLEVSNKNNIPMWKKKKRVQRAADYYENCYKIRVDHISKGITARDVDNVIKRMNQCKAMIEAL